MTGSTFFLCLLMLFFNTLLSQKGIVIIMNEEIKIVALEALKTMPNVSRLDVVNILECVQKCYAQVEDISIEEHFLIDELQYFINRLKA